ncbi:MAG: HD domain-containing protein [Gemmatimonadaceae bacterium]|nr:HD domain-containing protein [Gemmatimonadaceae bacterium]
MAPLNIPSLTTGSSVSAELLVLDRIERTTGGGDPFWVLSVGNSSGAMQSAPVWKDNAAWLDGVEKGRVVQVIGQVEVYAKTGARQLKITGPVRVLPAGTERIDEFLPRVEYATERLWDALDKLRGSITTPRLAEAVNLFFGDDAFRARFERTPGAVRGHHAKLGGLLLHVCEVASIGQQMAKTMRKANVDLVVAGALLHDIGKVEAYTVDAKGLGYDPRNHLIGHIVLGCLMFTERATAARNAGTGTLTDAQVTELQHMILSHHGSLEFGSPVQPMTIEAELLHWADESSAKADSFAEAVQDVELFAPGEEVSARKSWQLDRRLWRRPFRWDEV